MNVNEINTAALRIKNGHRVIGRLTGRGVSYFRQEVVKGRVVAERFLSRNDFP